MSNAEREYREAESEIKKLIWRSYFAAIKHNLAMFNETGNPAYLFIND